MREKQQTRGGEQPTDWETVGQGAGLAESQGARQTRVSGRPGSRIRGEPGRRENEQLGSLAVKEDGKWADPGAARPPDEMAGR
jgi:hypothetical protein